MAVWLGYVSDRHSLLLPMTALVTQSGLFQCQGAKWDACKNNKIDSMQDRLKPQDVQAVLFA